jgi:hypothetical protein
MIPVPRFPPRGPRGRSFPRFVGTIEALRLPAGPPAALRCLRLAVPREHAAVCSRRRRVCRRRAWGWSLGIPGRDGFRGDDRISQVPGEPPFPFAHAPSTPAGRCAPGMAERTAWPPLRERRRRRRRKTFEAQSHGFRAGGLRITMPVTRHRARLASRCSAQALLGRLSPTGLPRKVSNLHHARRPPFPSFLAQSPLFLLFLVLTAVVVIRPVPFSWSFSCPSAGPSPRWLTDISDDACVIEFYHVRIVEAMRIRQ